MSFSQGNPAVSHVISTANCLVFGNTSSGNALSVQQLGAGNVVSFSNASGGSNVFVMNNLGRVGLGTTNPGYSFDVLGVLRAGNPISASIYLTNSEVKWRGDGTAHFSIFNQNSTFQVRNTSGNSEPGTAGSNLVSVTTAGNVGIGTTSPSYILQVNSSSTTPSCMGAFLAPGIASGGTSTFLAIGGAVATAQSGALEFINYGTNTSNVVRTSMNGYAGSALNITSTGVGIGITNPGTPMSVQGVATSGRMDVYGDFIEIGAGRTSDGAAAIDFHAAEATYGDYASRIIRFGGANGNTDLIHRGTGNFNINGQDASAILFLTSGTERMRITYGGSVGIGTNNPGYLLDVASSMRLNGNYTYIGGSGGAASTSWAFNHIDTAVTFKSILWGYANSAGNSGELGFNYVGSGSASNYVDFGFYGSRPLAITYGGNVGIGATNPSVGLVINKTSGMQCVGTYSCQCFYGWNVYNGMGNQVVLINHVNNGDTQSWNAAGAIMNIGRSSSNGRSVSAGGTLNANGADYAEYMTKTSDFSIKKGDVVGVNSHGLLTNVFSESVTFVVKSTDPSYVGGDTWGSEEAIGMTSPDKTPQKENESDEDYAKRQQALSQFNTKLEEARARVDRIAFAGQVPVNVLGATPGQYIVPVANDDGSIGGQAVSSPTFEQYMAAVGKVINVLPDGRAQIIVKVV